MNNLTNISSKSKSLVSKRIAVLSMIGIAICNAIAGIIQLTDEQSSQSTVVGIEHVGLACFSIMVILLVPVMFHVASLVGNRRAAVITSVGAVALAALSTSSNIRGEDASFFAAVAVPANLMIFAGFIVAAVGLARRTNLTRLQAATLPFMWFVALPLSTVGGGLLVAAFWGSVAWMTEHDRIYSTEPPADKTPAQSGNVLPEAA